MKNMSCCGERGKSFWIKRAIFIPIAIAAGVFIFGLAVMCLWNAILPAVLGVTVISFWQALGILLLAKILFGGFPGHCKGGHQRFHDHHMHMRDKWMHLSAEEKEKMRSKWCGCDEPSDKKE